MTPDHSTWLDSDDPLKRMVALKRNGLSVDQLRQAMADEDPRVREMAVLHDDMTDGLLHEAIKHPDLATRQTALRHPGITEKHLDAVLHDPELREHVAGHPRITEAQKSYIVGDQLTGPALREELMKAVSTGIGYIHFPGLGQASPVEAMPSTAEQMSQRLRVRGQVHKDTNAGYTWGYTTMPNSPEPIAPEYKGYGAVYNVDHRGWHGTRSHETQHGVFKRLAQEFGGLGRRNVLGHLHAQLNDKEHAALNAIMSHPSINGHYPPDVLPEEKICYAQNYVGDPWFRKTVHQHLKLRTPERQYAFQALVRGAVQKMRSAAASLKSGDLGLQKSSQEDMLKAWVNTSAGGAFPALPHPGTRFTKIETFQPKLGLYHHVYHMPHFEEEGYTPMMHVISTKPSPFDQSGMVSSATVGTHKDINRLKEEHGVKVPLKGEAAQVHFSATSPGLRGHGYGHALYENMLRYHRGLVSDGEVSDDATRRWTKLHATPGYQGQLGERGNFKSPHWAHAGKSPELKPTSVIENPEHHPMFVLQQKHEGEELGKVSPPMSFPRLKITNRRESEIIDDPKQLYNSARRLFAADERYQVNANPVYGVAFDAESRADRAKSNASQMHAATKLGAPPMHGWSIRTGHSYQAGVMGPKLARVTPDEVRSNLQHEDLHGVFSLVERKYGRKARTLLASRLLQAMPKSHLHAIESFHHHQAGDWYKQNTPSAFDEEKLASLVNYMNSAKERERYHADHTETEARIHDNTLKRAYKQLMAHSRRVSEKWLDPREEISEVKEAMQKAFSPKAVRTPKPRQQGPSPMGVGGPEFKNWFGESKITHPKTGAPLRVYHGTTHDFTRFGASRANPENFWGGGHYFTDSAEDVNANYATRTGQDLKNRVQQEVERSEHVAESPQEARELKRQVKQKLVGPAPRVIPAYLRMKNPLMLTKEGGTQFSIDVDDDGNETGNGVDLHDAIHRVAPMYGADGKKIWDDVHSNHGDDMASGGAHASHVMDTLRDSVNMNDVTDDEGRLMGGEFAAEVAREMGHDGIVHDADRFSGMKGTQGARHYITWDPASIKGVYNKTWDPTSNEYHKVEGDENNPDEVHDWDQPIPNQRELGMQSIQRMKDAGKKQRALDFMDYVDGKIEKRPSIEPELERHLGGFGIVDPQGYPFDEGGYDLDKPLPGKRSKGGQVPDALAESKRQRSWADYHLPYQKSEDLDKTVLDPDAGYTFAHESFPGDENAEWMGHRPSTIVTAHHGGRQIGRASVYHSPGGLMTAEVVRVEPEHRRRGVASAMYAHAEKVTGRKMVPSSNRTPEGEALWAGNTQFGKSESLEKMALVHDSAEKPMVVYRVQDSRGRGPYEADVLPNSFRKPRRFGDRQSRPVPQQAFSEVGGVMEPVFPDTNVRFGFEKPEHAEQWFGKKLLADLATKGFQVVPVKARKVYRADNRNILLANPQAMFVPHEDVQKSEDLEKMAIADLKPGRKTMVPGNVAWVHHDYSHLLPAAERKNYRMVLSTRAHPESDGWYYADHKVRLFKGRAPIQQYDEPVGKVEGHTNSGNLPSGGVGPFLGIEFARLANDHRRKGLGLAMYEALMTHAYHKHGARTVVGEDHSTAAHGVHEALARKHGMKYSAETNVDPRFHDEADFDDARGHYNYAMKAEQPMHKFEDQMQAVAAAQGGASTIHGPLCRAAAFLSGKLIDENRFRQALALDLEPAEAALKAAGLEPTPDTLKAIWALVEIQNQEGLNKGEGDHTVSARDPRSQPLADELVEAMDRGDDRPVQFKGKHTGGMQIVRVEDGKQWLLKPGSGNLSPAAGVREETASQSSREGAFYEVADAWGLGQWLPVTHVLEVDRQETAVMELLPLDWMNMEKLRDQNPHQLQNIIEKLKAEGTLYKWAVLDMVLGSPDRHGNNLMVGTEEDGFPVKLIDHGSTFAGDAFDPSHDASSFIPFYLRATAGKRWKTMTNQERLAVMPTANLAEDDDLQQWVESLDPKVLVDVLSKYGIRAEPSLKRLGWLKSQVGRVENLSREVNKFWVGLSGFRAWKEAHPQ
jgi:GNAT superfamily N-acetyltransferase